MEALLMLFVLSVGINVFMFTFAYFFQTDKLTDISFTLTILSLAAFKFFSNTQSFYTTVLFVLVGLWAIRLGGYLFYRVHKMKRDDRFDDFRSSFFSFFGFWFVQGISCAIMVLPLYFVFDSFTFVNGNVFWIGTGIAVLGFAIEALADYQKFSFKKRNPSKFMKSGLWSVVRHPNYTGELAFWWGLFIASLGMSVPVWTIISPLWITLLILKFSGIPPLLRKWKRNYGDDPEFNAYLKSTAKLIPSLY